MDIKAKRKKIIDRIVDIMQTIEPEGTNAEMWKERLSKMTDKEFDTFMRALQKGQANPNEGEQLHVYTPNMKVAIKPINATNAAEKLGLKLFERVYLHDDVAGKKYLTPREYLILSLPIRRVRQYILGKMSTAPSDKTINAMTGQVTGPDKTASMTYVEAQALKAKGMDKVLTEYVKIRGGDVVAYRDTVRQLHETGTCNISDVGDRTRAKTPDVLKALFAGMYIDTNIVED